MAEWISVNIRLPESSKHVLIYSKEGGVAEGSYSAYRWVQFRWSSTNVQVTHWAEMPKPPKEGE